MLLDINNICPVCGDALSTIEFFYDDTRNGVGRVRSIYGSCGNCGSHYNIAARYNAGRGNVNVIGKWNKVVKPQRFK